MSPMRIDRQKFLENLRRSALLTDQELQSVLPRLPETNRGRVVARALVEWGLITKFQAELLLVGRTNGFTLGQYRILDQIGTGGMGRVFKARHQAMNRIVALKVLAPQLMKTERARQLFQREMQAAGRLMHTNIVTAYDANEVGQRHFLVMEYVDGPNLDQLVRERGPLPVGLACDIIRQAANGLQCAFELGMVHRDIKPANLLVQRSPSQNPSLPCVVKILDFGLARLQAADDDGTARKHTILTSANTIMGTPDFVSPEQARDMHKVDIRSDLYCLGCTFYYLLTGRVPFPGGAPMDKLIRHNSHEPTPVEELRPEVTPAVAEILRRLMAKKPEARFQTPAELATALAPVARPGPAAAQAAPKPVVLAGDSDGLTPDPGPEAEEPGKRTAEDGAALVGTLPPDLSPTPLSTVDMTPPTAGDTIDVDYRRRLTATLLCAVSIATGLVGALGLLLFAW
jgi:eukaryotic-like serine/threonine-protein kinase